MEHGHRPDQGNGEFDSAEGLALALNYLNDPADVPCPTCGPGTMEVVAYLDADQIREGVVRASEPRGEYTVVLYCHECKRAAALDLSPDGLGQTGEEQRADPPRDDLHEGDGGSDQRAA